MFCSSWLIYVDEGGKMVQKVGSPKVGDDGCHGDTTQRCFLCNGVPFPHHWNIFYTQILLFLVIITCTISLIVDPLSHRNRCGVIRKRPLKVNTKSLNGLLTPEPSRHLLNVLLFIPSPIPHLCKIDVQALCPLSVEPVSRAM